MFNSFKNYLNKRKRFINWRKINQHNETVALNDFDFNCVSIGKNTYGGIQIYNFNKGNALRIGNYCSIASNVMFILNADHNIKCLSTFPFKVKSVHTESFEAISKGDIVVDDDVWIGYGATILSGVHIGQGAVIAAGAVVVSDVEPYSVVGGVPAKELKQRFSKSVIQFLLTLDYAALSKEMISIHLDDLYEDVGDDLNYLKKRLDWFPKKHISQSE